MDLETVIADQLATIFYFRNWRYLVWKQEVVESFKTMYKYHWSQVLETLDDVSQMAELFLISLDLVNSYYDIWSKIGRNKNWCYYDLELDCILKIHAWSKQVSFSTFGMVMVGTANVYSTCNDQRCIDAMIDNLYKGLSH